MSFSQFVRNGYDSETKHTSNRLVVKSDGTMVIKIKKIPELPYELMEMIFNIYEKSELRALCDKVMPRVLGYINQDDAKAEWRECMRMFGEGTSEYYSEANYERRFCRGSKFLTARSTRMPLNTVIECNEHGYAIAKQGRGSKPYPTAKMLAGAKPALVTEHAILTMNTVGGMLCRPWTIEALNSKGQSIPLYKMYGKSGDRYLQINRAQKMFYKKVTPMIYGRPDIDRPTCDCGCDGGLGINQDPQRQSNLGDCVYARRVNTNNPNWGINWEN